MYIIGETNSRPLRRPRWWTRVRGAPSNAPPTRPPWARKPSTTVALKPFTSASSPIDGALPSLSGVDPGCVRQRGGPAYEVQDGVCGIGLRSVSGSGQELEAETGDQRHVAGGLTRPGQVGRSLGQRHRAVDPVQAGRDVLENRPPEHGPEPR